jgi:hypothetical protein
VGQFVRGGPVADVGKKVGYTTALPSGGDTKKFYSDGRGSHTHTGATAQGGDHSHNMWKAMSRDSNYGDGGSTYVGGFSGSSGRLYAHPNTNTVGNHTHTLTGMSTQADHSHYVNGGGDDETSPDHIILQYVIRAE